MASNAPKNNRASYVAALEKLADGLANNAAVIPQLLIGGVAITPADAAAKLRARIPPSKAVETTHAAWQAAVEADRVATAQLKPFLCGLRPTLLAMFAGQIDMLASFGLTERKFTPADPATKAAAALKALATRAARGTLGKRQKAAIKAPVVITPATATPVTNVPVT